MAVLRCKVCKTEWSLDQKNMPKLNSDCPICDAKKSIAYFTPKKCTKCGAPLNKVGVYEDEC